MSLTLAPGTAWQTAYSRARGAAPDAFAEDGALRKLSTGEKLSFEIMVTDRGQERLALIYADSLRRIGVDARVAHLVVYTLGLPVLRTLAFVGGFIAQVMLALALFKFA